MRNKAIYISLLLILNVLGFSALSQKTIVRGVVVDKVTQATLPFATVFFLGPKILKLLVQVLVFIIDRPARNIKIFLICLFVEFHFSSLFMVICLFDS